MGMNGPWPGHTVTAQTFYEFPCDIHTISCNASRAKAARFLVFLIKGKDAPILVPVK
jgi:hypothetical protein